MMDEASKNRTGLIRSIIVLTICIISCTVFLVNHKQEIKLSAEDKEETSEVLDSTSTNAIEAYDERTVYVDRKSITVESVNDMFRSSILAFTDSDNLKTINISSVTLYGYVSTNPSEKLGKIDGTFSCLDSTNECYYGEDVYEVDGSNTGFSMYAVFTQNQNGDYYISMMNDPSMKDNDKYVENFQEIK